MDDMNKNIWLISTQLYEFMDDDYPLNEERIVALEFRLKELFDKYYKEGYDKGYDEGYEEGKQYVLI